MGENIGYTRPGLGQKNTKDFSLHIILASVLHTTGFSDLVLMAD